MMKNLNLLFDKIKTLLNQNKSPIIGIDGLGGAGKTTISEIIIDELKKNNIHTVLLHIDDFIHKREVRYNPNFPDWQCYYDLQWRYDYFCEVIDRIKSSGYTNVELYDKENDLYINKHFSVSDCTVIIVEGIFLQRKELVNLFDYMIYIDIPERVRLNRVLLRDTYIGTKEEILFKYENRYLPAEHKYIEEYNPSQKADFIVCE